MLHLKLIVAAVVIWASVSGSEGIASPRVDGAFLASTPGVSVEYLIVNASARRTTGALEVITVSKNAPDGEVRTQTSATSDNETLVFGSRVARPDSAGYIVTSTAGTGLIGERRFVRASIADINAAIVALTSSVNRKRVASDRQAARAQLRAYSAMSSEDAHRLVKAQLTLATVAAQLNLAQSAADRLAAIARQARADANAKIDESGVSLQQNESREAAMRLAADADQNAEAAQRQADLAGLALTAAKVDVQLIRAHIAMVTQRTHAIATQATGDDAEGR